MLPSAPPTDLAKMIATERAFSARCAQVGIRDSFIEYFAPHGLLFAPEPANARERLRKRPKGPDKFLLQWEPKRAEISRAGDLGFSTGPVYMTDRKTKKRSHTSFFFSVWQRQTDGEYRVLLDLGNPIPPREPKPIPFFQFRKPRLVTGIRGDEARVEATFRRRADAVGFTEALRQSLTEDAWLYRPGQLPLSVAEAKPVFARNPLAMKWRFEGAYLAESRDYLVTRGQYELATDQGPESGNFIRVWRRQPLGWKIVIDLMSPYKPPK